MVQTDDQKWIQVTNNGGWDTHEASSRLLAPPRLLGCRLTTAGAFPGGSEVWDEHPVLEDHRNRGGREDGEAGVTEEHPDPR